MHSRAPEIARCTGSKFCVVINRLRDVNPELIYPGHGSKPITREELDTVEVQFAEQD